jgi:prepilin-type N-terminal cleavage/methylation domain-containing protein
MSTHQAIGRRAGLTLVELLLVVVIVSILAGLAIPNYQNVVTKARAADLLGRIDVVEVAVQSYLGDNNAWPGETGTGVIPTGIVSYLPANFSFTGEDFQLDWENGGGLIGVGIVTDNQLLGNALVDLAGPGRWFVSGNRYVFILEQS